MIASFIRSPRAMEPATYVVSDVKSLQPLKYP